MPVSLEFILDKPTIGNGHQSAKGKRVIQMDVDRRRRHGPDGRFAGFNLVS
jgi:hypothetical protein